MSLDVLRSILLGLLVVLLAGTAFVVGRVTGGGGKAARSGADVVHVSAENRAKSAALVESALAERFVGRHREALDHLREARQLDPNLRGVEYQIGLTHLDLGEHDLAVSAAERSIEREEETANARVLAAMAMMRRAPAAAMTAVERAKILEYLGQARSDDPLSPAPPYALGEYYRAVGDPQAAGEAYQRALERTAKMDNVLICTVKAGLAGIRLDSRREGAPFRASRVAGVIPPEQLFFGAADALLRGDTSSARALLEEARQRLPADVYRALLQDTFFQDYIPPGLLDESGTSPQG
jgi:tetratricopeptide (TPR) repeat protein